MYLYSCARAAPISRVPPCWVPGTVPGIRVGREKRGALSVRAPIPVNGRTETTRRVLGTPQVLRKRQQPQRSGKGGHRPGRKRSAGALGAAHRRCKAPRASRWQQRQANVYPQGHSQGCPAPGASPNAALRILSRHLLVCPFTSSHATPCSRETSPESSRRQDRPEVRPAGSGGWRSGALTAQRWHSCRPAVWPCDAPCTQ